MQCRRVTKIRNLCKTIQGPIPRYIYNSQVSHSPSLSTSISFYLFLYISYSLTYFKYLDLFLISGRNEGIRGIQKGLFLAYPYTIVMNGTRLGSYEPLKRFISSITGFSPQSILRREGERGGGMAGDIERREREGRGKCMFDCGKIYLWVWQQE